MRFVALVWLMSFVLCLVEANPIESSSVPSSIPEPSAPAPAEGEEEMAPAEEGSKMSKFLDDFTSAFKQGTAKMKESLENAATSVKDGVLQGYDYVRSKLTGDRAVTEEPPPPAGPVPGDQEQPEVAEDTDATPITSTQAAGLTSSLKPARSTPPTVRPSSTGASDEPPGGGAAGAAIGTAHVPAQIVPNDDGAEDDRIFFNDKDLEEAGEGERDGTEQPVGSTTTITTTTTMTPTVDNRFILAGPLACKTGQEAVNGKCRNVF
ncbi:uncharacterized protein LOC126579989 [Anopheles aquasalis]|uniref:uncharacterized protein LOC126579989 n=1 Tax=Anopheles aquasalis TaxID=42839 RepID=UPI00215A1981|nr:uncharacterized protein LOC126579989 [Anopheles aquasalis]